MKINNSQKNEKSVVGNTLYSWMIVIMLTFIIYVNYVS